MIYEQLSPKDKRLYRKYVIRALMCTAGIKSIDGQHPVNHTNSRLFALYDKLIGKHISPEQIKTVDNSAKDYIYVVGNRAKSICKIGYSKYPFSRLKSIQVGCPYPITIIALYEGSKETEKKLHNKFKKLKLSGEWFSLEGDLKESLIKNKDKSIV